MFQMVFWIDLDSTCRPSGVLVEVLAKPPLHHAGKADPPERVDERSRGWWIRLSAEAQIRMANGMSDRVV